MLLEPCKLPSTTMLSEHNRYKVSGIISQPIAVLVFFCLLFCAWVWVFFNESVKSAWLCISLALVAATIFNTTKRKEI